MGVTHLDDVGQKGLGKFEITELPILLFRFSSPGAEMNFVNADRAPDPILVPPRFHPGAVAPAVPVKIVNKRGGGAAMLIEKREGIALQKDRAAVGPDFEFVMDVFADRRNE